MKKLLEVKMVIIFLGILLVLAIMNYTPSKSAIYIDDNNKITNQSIQHFLKNADYYFLVAGHTYGYQPEDTKGIHPPFWTQLQSKMYDKASFIVLLGDIVRASNKKLWATAIEQLNTLNIKYYFVMGNHDYDKGNYSMDLFTELFGNVFYSFIKEKELFIVFNTQIEPGQITDEQIKLFNDQLKDNPEIQTVFIFLHELLWLSADNEYKGKYKGIVCNRFYDREFISNFWNTLYPILEKHADKNFVIFAGDAGALPKVIPAFYEDLGNVHLIATGMGIGDKQNFIVVKKEKGNFYIKMLPVKPGIDIKLKEFEFIPPKIIASSPPKIKTNQPAEAQNTNDKPQEASKNISLYLAAADNLFNQKKFTQALMEYEKIFELDPKNQRTIDSICRTNCKLGEEEYKKKLYSQAIKYYRIGLEKCPKNVEAINGVGRAHCRIADEAYRNKDYDNAIANYKTAVDLRPDYLEAYKGLGLSYHKTKNYPLAIENFQLLKELHPTETKWADEMIEKINKEQE